MNDLCRVSFDLAEQMSLEDSSEATAELLALIEAREMRRLLADDEEVTEAIVRLMSGDYEFELAVLAAFRGDTSEISAAIRRELAKEACYCAKQEMSDE